MLKHLLYQTYRSQFGWLWMFWFICVAQAHAGAVGVMSPAIQNTRTTLFLAQCLLAGLAISGGIQIHAMVGDNVFWKTRPIGRPLLLQVNSIFVLGLVYLPFMVSLLVGSVAAGFSGAQLFTVALEWALYFGVGVTAISAVASHTRNFVMFLSVGGCVFLYFTSFGAGYRYLLSHFDGLRPSSGLPYYYQTSSLLVALILLMICGAFGFVWRQLRNNIGVSIGAFTLSALVFFALVFHGPFGFLRPNLPIMENIEMELITEDFSKDPEPLAEQVLWSHFRAKGLPEGTVFMPTVLSAKFDADARKEPKLLHTYHQSSRSSSGMDYFEDSPSSHTALRVLQSHYPDDTVWSGRWSTHRRDDLPNGGKRWPSRGAMGRFSGYLRGEVVAIRQFADLPLQNGFAGLGEGYGVAIRLIADEEGGLQFEIREATPELMYARRREFRRNFYRTSGIYVLYHPDSREAILLDESGSSRNAATFLSNQSQITLRFHVPRSALRERLNGHEADDWAAGLRLHVYHHRRIGRLSWHFDDKQYHYQRSHRRHISVWESDSNTGFESLKELKWPGANDVAAAQKFAHEFVTRAPANFYSSQSSETTKMLTDIGPEIVPFFLNEAPYSYAMGQIVLRRAFQRLARREHIPALKKALVRDPSLASLAQSKRWEKECAPALTGLLRQRDRALPASALIILAKQATNEQFADLAWHATRCEHSQEGLYRILRELDGFPYEQVVRDAWNLARLKFVSEQNLAVFAAELGELDALHYFIRQLNSSSSEPRDRRAFEILRAKLGTTGNDAALRQWLLKNAARIHFDSAKSKYVLHPTG